MTVTAQRLKDLKALEAHHVCLALEDGSSIEGWELVSVNGAAPDTAWVWDEREHHAFVPIAQVADFWEVPHLERANQP
jgi:hypothetical protein